jgi:riboflavin kinase/FMN adenylyltransferase
VHLFDFDADLYGQTIEVACVDKIRDEQKFDGLEKLIQQLHADKETAKLMFNL